MIPQTTCGSLGTLHTFQRHYRSSIVRQRPTTASTTRLPNQIFRMDFLHPIHSIKETYKPKIFWDFLDERKEGMDALEEMVDHNVLTRGVKDDRPWICLNVGTPACGKTTMLMLSCEHFVRNKIKSCSDRRCCAIFISFNDNTTGQSCDEDKSPAQRVYNRILYTLRDDKTLDFTKFVAQQPTSRPNEVLARIREVCGAKTHVLIAADELRQCGNKTSPEHIPQPRCVEAITALNELVRASTLAADAGLVFLVASSLGAVDVKAFATGSSTPFTLQPMLPLSPQLLRTVLTEAGAPDFKKRRGPLATGDKEFLKDARVQQLEDAGKEVDLKLTRFMLRQSLQPNFITTAARHIIELKDEQTDPKRDTSLAKTKPHKKPKQKQEAQLHTTRHTS